MDVLIAHADIAVRDILRAELARAGLEVGQVAGPAESVVACVEHDPDVVFLQWREGGQDALQAIKRHPDEFTVAVVAIGTPEELGDPMALLALGAQDVLVEPIRPLDVVPCCGSAIKVRHLQEAVLDLDHTVEEISHIDGLTRLYNRRFAFEQLTAQTSNALRHDRPLALLAVAVDELDRIEDELGCVAGDAVVQGVATCVGDRLRDEDVPARVARGEFLVLLPETTGESAACVAEGLRDCVAKRAVLDGRPITVSVGWAELDPARPDDFLADADRALERARVNGPGAVCGPATRRFARGGGPVTAPGGGTPA